MEKKQRAFRTTIGGQALIEGILMRGPEKDAIVVRSPEGLVTKDGAEVHQGPVSHSGHPHSPRRRDVHQLHDHRREGTDVLGGLFP